MTVQATNHQQAAIRTLCAAERRRVRLFCMSLPEQHPFWGALAYQLEFRMSPGMPAIACTDCYSTVWLNPEKTQHLSQSQLGFVLLHELGHVVLVSHERLRGRNQHLFNIAADYKINELVSKIEAPLRTRQPLYDPPRGTIRGLGHIDIYLDSKHDGKLTEAIYEELAAEALYAPSPLTIELSGVDGTGGVEVAVTDHGGGIDVHLPGNLTPAQRDEALDKIRVAIDAWSSSGRRGHMPSGALRELMPAVRYTVPWRQLLQRFVGAAIVRDDYSLSRPHKRYVMDELIVPGPFGEGRTCAVAAIDTSGSMSPSALSQISAEIRGIAEVVDELLLLVADAEVHDVVQSDAIEAWLESGRVIGGGGTDHRPVFAWLEARHIRPDVFIGLTDLRSVFPDRPPPYPVVWVTPAQHGAAPFGHVISIEERGETE